MIHCIVVGGDSPILLSWYKDGDLINPSETVSNPQEPWNKKQQNSNRKARSQGFEECQDSYINYNSRENFDLDFKSVDYLNQRDLSGEENSNRDGSSFGYDSAVEGESGKRQNLNSVHSRNSILLENPNPSIDPRVMVNQLGDRYSELRFTTLCPQHSGNYTCIAQNKVGETAYSDTLLVKGELE